MYIKVHKSYRDVIAICDSNLIGQKFEEGNKQLDVRESFYKGEEKNHEEILNLMKFYSKEDSTFNLVGEETIKTALEAGIITKEGIAHISNIPYALVLL